MLFLTSISPTSLALDARDTRLLWVGGEFFPRIMQSLVHQNLRAERYVMLYSDAINKQLAESMTEYMDQKLKLSYEFQAGLDPQALGFDQNYRYVIFITDPDLITPELVERLNQPHLLSFAPFIGSVPKGIDVGLHVESTVKPLINTKQLAQKTWAFRPFFNRIAEHYLDEEKHE